MKRHYGVEGFVGYWAGGKTLRMVERIWERQDRDPSLVVGSNFGYKRGNVVTLDTLEDMLSFAFTDFGGRQKIVALDEIGGVLRARASQAWPPAADLLFQQGRKLRCTVLWTTQSWRFTDVNVRRVTQRVTRSEGLFIKRITPRGVFPEEGRPRLFKCSEWRAPNPDCNELPASPDKTYHRFWRQDLAESYDSMALVEAVARQLARERERAEKVDTIREALVSILGTGELALNQHAMEDTESDGASPTP